MKYIFSALLILFLLNNVTGQISGVVTDADGDPLPFASVYVQGTTQGTTTNMNGEYFLDLEKGNYELVFQFIGFSQQIRNIKYSGNQLTLNIILEAEAISLNEIEIKANAEDPAYAIIRKAIAKRKYYKELVESFSCDVYIKGNVKILDAPEKILGQDIGDLEGSLDTNRQGIVYLSESVSKLYFKQADKYKEVMTSSKVSGNDNGFSFNSAREMDMDLYKNYVEYGRNVVSPIADGALNHYKYKLEGVLLDEQGHLINKIKIIPKRSEDPVYQGFIYIVDDLWNIQSTDIFLTGNRVQMPLFDTLHIRQTYVPVKQPDVWQIFSRTFSMTGGAFGFKFGGDFTGIYSNYNLAPNLSDKFFGNEIMKVEEGANDKDTSYWNNTRPVPLTSEESVDYYRKDSIKVVRESKPFMDSVDQVNNKLKFVNLLFGYTYSNSWKKQSWTVQSPINTFQFNAVQGANINLQMDYKKAFDKLENKKLTVGGKINYGFAEEKFRAAARLQYNYDPKKYSRLRIMGGREVVQFNEAEPISNILNTSYSLFNKRHLARYYDKKYLRIDHGSEVANGVLLFGILQYADRSPLVNNSDFSLFNKDREFAPNVPINRHLAEGELAGSKSLVGGISVRLRPGQKYYDYPDRKYIYGSKFPDLWIHYRRGFGIENGLESDVEFDRLSAVLQKRNIKMGLLGQSSFRFEAGAFLNNDQLFFQDYKHFMGSEISIGNSELYLMSFRRLPYYEYSTKKHWVEGHYEHKFQGFITDKLPLIRKLDWGMVVGANFLYTAEEKDYLECLIGFDNIGFGILKLFRFDVIGSFRRGSYDGLGYMFGITLPIDDLQM
ncbi:MAG: DUF5686 and carboxypeptidase regulatory-like domain-containing protein [Bacteroidota bacterium]